MTISSQNISNRKQANSISSRSFSGWCISQLCRGSFHSFPLHCIRTCFRRNATSCQWVMSTPTPLQYPEKFDCRLSSATPNSKSLGVRLKVFLTGECTTKRLLDDCEGKTLFLNSTAMWSVISATFQHSRRHYEGVLIVGPETH